MQIRDALVHLLLKQPFYGYMAASIAPADSKAVQTTRMITGPTLRLLYNKDWYEALKGEQPIGVIIHELLHLILLHPFRKGNREHMLWAVACDMAVNENIPQNMLPEDYVTADTLSREIRVKLPNKKSAEEYYDILAGIEGQFSFLEMSGDVTIRLKSGMELHANLYMEEEASEINRNAAKSMLSELLEQAKFEGDIPCDIEGSIAALYKSDTVNWRNVLRRFLSGKGRTVVRKSCKRESKRFENLPGSKRSTGIQALLAIDASGSISEQQLTAFQGELLSIQRITGATIHVTQFDTACTPPVKLEKYARDGRRFKSGGTDYRPVFELADKLRIHLLMVFTDGEGKAPEQVNQQVVWVLTKGAAKPAEYGHVVTLGA